MNPVLKKLAGSWPPERWAGLTVLVAVSGGADSIALLRALHQLKCPSTTLRVGHFNHGLRGEESDEDARFVQAVAQRLDCPFHCNRLGEPQTESMAKETRVKVGEADLRASRYQFLEEIAGETGARYLSTAHTREDQAETVLFHLFRGTGAGFAAMRPFRTASSNRDLVIARPLLDVSRDEVLSYLHELDQPFRFDRSNASEDYSRNWIRKSVLPLVETRFPQAKEAIARFATMQREMAESIERQADGLIGNGIQFVRLVRDLQNRDAIEVTSLRIDARNVRDLPWEIVQTALRRCWTELAWSLGAMSHEHWCSIREAIQQDGAKTFTLPGNLQVQWIDDFLEIRS